MAKKNDIEHAMKAYWRSVSEQFETRIEGAFLAGVKFGLELAKAPDEPDKGNGPDKDKGDAKD
jgi:hypothetical protein